jgi:uncharacterized protein YkwD
MKPMFQRLTWALMMTGVLVSLAVLATPAPVHADTCTPVASPAANVNDPNAAFDTGAHVITTFNFARQQEGCNVSLGIDPTAYDAATPQQQTLLLVNAERQDRGLPPLQLDTTLISQIAFNHSQERAQYHYDAHESPINQPGGKNDPISRMAVNPAVAGHATCYAENIFAWNSTPDDANPAHAIYWYMYQDADSQWGHRQDILGYICGNPPTFGHFDWIGIGNFTVTDTNGFHFWNTLDFLDDANATTYTPPATADTQPPTMDGPTIVDANTVQVTNVQDESDGSSGAAGVTGVVFYVGSAVDTNGNFQTVVATQDKATPGTWTASLSATDPTTLHAVAVDGSGNYTDTAGHSSS